MRTWRSLCMLTMSAALIAGCGGGGGSDDPEPNPAPPANPNLASTTVSAANGASLTLDAVGKVTVPAGAVSDGTTLVVEKTTSAAASSVFAESADLFGGFGKATYEVRVQVGKTQPTAPLDVELAIPDTIKSAAQSTDEVRIFYLSVYQSPDEGHTTVEPLPQRGLSSDPALTASLPIEAFAPNASGDFEATVMLALTPTAQPTRTNSAHPGRAKALASTSMDECKGLSLESPLEGGTVSSGFGPRPAPTPGASTMHRGIDYAVPVGTDVRAAAQGIVRIKINNGGLGVGYGYYIVIEHINGGKTLYGHLQNGSATVSNGTLVQAGTVIAKSGNTGTSSGPHLHFEYAPGGVLFQEDGRIDPTPCIGSVTNASLSISDNGNIADDAFSILLDGRPICSTAIGAANNCPIGLLRIGNYVLTLKVDVAPDDVGTYLIQSNASNMTIDGQPTASGSLPQGSQQNFNLQVTEPVLTLP